MNAFARAIAEAVQLLLDKMDTVTVEDVVTYVYDNRPEVVHNHQEYLIYKAAKEAAKRALSARSDEPSDDTQLSLPGLHLPAAIAVPLDDGTYEYVAAHKATWQHLVAGREERVKNVVRAQDRLDEYERVMERLASLMEDDPSMTVGKAVEIINRSAAA